MIAYASRTGTRRNLDALEAAGWRLLVSAASPRDPGGFRYALDNGAWSWTRDGGDFREAPFEAAVERFGERADFVVVPDLVARGRESLELSLRWLPRLEARLPWPGPRLLLAAQDGITEEDLAGVLSDRVGIFVGGSTEWKLATMVAWGALARRRGAYLHVGRVNTARRIRLCHDAAASSFDGSSVSRFAVNIPRLSYARDQPSLFAPELR